MTQNVRPFPIYCAKARRKTALVYRFQIREPSIANRLIKEFLLPPSAMIIISIHDSSLWMKCVKVRCLDYSSLAKSNGFFYPNF